MSDPFDSPAGDDKTYSFDLTEDPATSKYYVAPGEHLATCVHVEEAVSKAGSEMLVWTFAIKQGEYAGRELKTWTVLKASAIWRLRDVAKALGLLEEGEKSLNFKTKDAINRDVMITVIEDEYNGKTTSKIDEVRAA